MAAFALPIYAVLAAQCSRLEKGVPIWSILQFGGGMMMTIFLVLPPRIEGDGALPDQVVILSFPSLESIHRFMADPAYAPFRDARIASTKTEILAIEG